VGAHPTRLEVSLALAALLALACTSTPEGRDDAGTADVGHRADAGVEPEAGVPDATPAPEDAGAPPTADQLATQLAQSECNWVARCRERELAEIGGAEACASTKAPRWQAHLRARGDLAAAAGQTAACVDALASAQCWQAPRELGRACWPILSAGKGRGEACASSTDCRDGFCASAAPGLECGQCEPWRGWMASCVEDPSFACGPGARCVDGRCEPLPAAGLGCDSICQDYLDCIFDNEDVICLPPVGLGDRCDPAPGLFRKCPEERALACVDRECVRATLVALGETCDEVRWCRTPEQVCGPDGRCQLRPRGAVGERCEIHEDCEADAFCEGSLCAARRGEAEACTTDAECASPLRCLGSPRACHRAPSLDCH